jgi:tetratricopeptide (TPR) repeat protein
VNAVNEENEMILDEVPEGKRGLPKHALYLIAAGVAVVLVAAAVSLAVWFRAKPAAEPETAPSAGAVRTEPPERTEPPAATLEAGLEQAVSLYNEKRYEEAVEALSAVLLNSPDSGPAYLYRGGSYFWLGIYDLAVADLTQALLRTEEDIADILAYRGASYVFLQWYPEAVSDLSRAIEMAPGSTSAYIYRAKAYEAMGLMDLSNADTAIAERMEAAQQ